jgi:hypothetical protein
MERTEYPNMLVRINALFAPRRSMLTSVARRLGYSLLKL